MYENYEQLNLNPHDILLLAFSCYLHALMDSNFILASKRFRTIFTDDQLQKLEARFQQTKYPDPIERHDIAVSLDLSETKVKVWFQNRRMKMKRNYWKARNNYMSQTYFPTTIAVPCSLPCPTNIPESYCEGQECSYCPMLLMPAQYQRPVAYNPASDPHQQRPRAYSPSSDHPQHHPLGYSYSRNQSPTYPSDNEMQERHTFSSPPTAYSYPQSNFNAPISRTANISDSKTNVFGWTRGREDLSMNGYGNLRGQKTSSSQAGSCKLRPIVIK